MDEADITQAGTELRWITDTKLLLDFFICGWRSLVVLRHRFRLLDVGPISRQTVEV
jgi:hypothetical protein